MLNFFINKYLNKTIKISQLLLILVIFAVICIFYGAVVRHVTLGGNKLGFATPIIKELSMIIENINHIIDPYKSFKSKKKFNTLQRSLEKIYLSDHFLNSNEDNFILLSRYDGKTKRSVVELVDIKKKKILHKWIPDINKINKETKLNKKIIDLDKNFSENRYQIIHPLLLNDGSIIFHGMYTPLVKVDICSNLIWTIDDIFHHSIEKDENDFIWIPSSNVDEDGIAVDYLTKINNEGSILLKVSLKKLLNDINYPYLNIYAGSDPFHLNDIQPIKKNVFEKGNYILSMRNISSIAIYDEKQNKIKKIKQGSWVHQHDVDEKENYFLFLDNNLSSEKSRVNSHNRIIILDNELNKVSEIYSEVLENYKISTLTEGLIEIDEDKIIFEETNNGALYRLSERGVDWLYTNFHDENIYRLNWSRIISNKLLNDFLKSKNKTICD